MPRAKALNLPADLVLRADTGRAFRYRLIAPLRDDGTRNVAVRLVAHLARGGGRRAADLPRRHRGRGATEPARGG